MVTASLPIVTPEGAVSSQHSATRFVIPSDEWSEESRELRFVAESSLPIADSAGEGLEVAGCTSEIRGNS
jgi:hypothetical protein